MGSRRPLPNVLVSQPQVDQPDRTFRIKVVETATNAAAFVTVPAELLGSPVYGNLRRAYTKLVGIVGRPPFQLELGKKTRRVHTFEGLRTAAPRGA